MILPETKRFLHRRLTFLFSCLSYRGYFDAVPILNYTQPVLEAFANETKVSGQFGIIGETSIVNHFSVSRVVLGRSTEQAGRERISRLHV